MPVYTDQTGRSVSLQSVPQRIVSLVPSQTELLYHLGLEDEVAGITKFCVHPQEWFRKKTRVGGTKQLSLDIIRRLQPDLIIANKEENVKEQVEALSADHPVWISDVNDLESACCMIGSLGDILQRAALAQSLIRHIKEGFERMHASIKSSGPPLRTAYLIWKDPYMVAGGDTFIHDMLTRCGFSNIFEGQTRYPSVNISQLQEANCELLLLSSEPYPFKQKHANELQQHLPVVKIVPVNGEMFSWYGSRMVEATAYFIEVLEEVKSQK